MQQLSKIKISRMTENHEMFPTRNICGIQYDCGFKNIFNSIILTYTHYCISLHTHCISTGTAYPLISLCCISTAYPLHTH